MPDMGFRGTATAFRAGLLGLALLGAMGGALAATTSAGLGVYLRITGACQVDSRAVFADAAPPRVACREDTPYAVQLQREPLPLPEQGTFVPGGSTRVVTLVF